MAEYIENVVAQTSKLDWAFPFERKGQFPLDRSAVFSSLEDATKYATGEATDERKLGGTSYVGQIISVYEAGEEGADAVANAYIISPARTLVKLASTTVTGDIAETINSLQEALDTLAARVDDVEELLGSVSDKADANEDAIAGIIEEIGVKASEGVDATGIYAEIAAAKKEATYDDTALAARVKGIEDDHLVAQDKDELTAAIGTAKTEAIADAKAETEAQIKALEEAYLTGTAGTNALDTLNEIAQWIADDAAGAAKVIKDVNTILGDYLKAADKTELQGNIDTVNGAVEALETYVGAIPEDADSENVVAYIHEVVDALKIGDYAKASELTALTDRVTAAEEAVASHAETLQEVADTIATLTVKSVDSATIVNTNGVISVGEIAQSNVAGLIDALSGKVNTRTSEYKGEQKAWTLLSPENQEKLASLVIGENGVEVSGRVNADNVEGLGSWITANKSTVSGLVSDTLQTTIDTAAANAASAVKGIIIGGETISPVDGNVELPVATLSKLGLVKSSEDENKVKVNEDGTMEVNSLNVNKLVQTEGEELILLGGSPTDLK